MRELLFVAAAALAAATACGPDGRNNPDGCVGVCTALGYQACNTDGTFDPPVACGPDQICDPGAGCVVCPPNGLYCAGVTANDVYQCNADGTDGTLVMSCPEGNACSEGACKTPCAAAEDNPSNLGCDFWAVDLDNEAFNLLGASNDAAAQQFAIVAANNNDFPVQISVSKNSGRVGEALQESTILQTMVPPRTAMRIDLPQREVDGAMGQNGMYVRNSGSGTFVSPHAYHVVSTGPVVVYQFNPVLQQYSNDASTLIPRHALGNDYTIIGYDTANPCGLAGMSIESIPDHGAVTIIAIEDDTHVTVTPTHPIMASGGDSGFAIAETPRGGTLNLTLGRYTVANLESKMVTQGSFTECMQALTNRQTGDFTGTKVHADKPILVFTSHERGIGFGGATNVQFPPGWDDMTDDVCCTDHFEEQLLPTTAFGKEFAVARSPVRSTNPSWKEPDITRIVATVDGTVITTNLPAPNNAISLDAGEYHTFAAVSGFTISSNNAIEVAQYLVPQQFVKEGQIGDPSQLLIPAAEQHRKDYVFLVPSTFTKNYIVVAKPVDGIVLLDGVAIEGVEFSCVQAPIGVVAGIDYEQVTCEATPGHHMIASEKPFGLSVYGYHSVGSYAFVGGSDVKIINPILKPR